MDTYIFTVYLPSDPILQFLLGAMTTLGIMVIVRGILDTLPG